MVRKLLILSITLLLLLNCATAVSAEPFDTEKNGSISVTLTEQYEQTPIVGAKLWVYYVATVGINTDGKLNYIYTEAFKEMEVAVDDTNLLAKLDAYVWQNKVPAVELTTDDKGTAAYQDVPLGLYYIKQPEAVQGFAPCTPFLVTVPMQADDGFTYAVNASPKTQVAKLTSITIKKEWNTDASTKIADSVTVQLLRNGVVLETALLNAENNWQMTFTDMPESDAYTINEVNVPKGFTATYKRSGYVFTVTNTSTLAQTGQLIWPIPVLAISGIALLFAGIVLLQKKREANA